MKAVPRHLVILGGGPVGVEMAQVVLRLGGQATIVEAGPRLLGHEAAPLGEALGEDLRRDGAELVLGAKATAARRDGTDYALVLGDGRELRGDHLLIATGRRPRTAGLGLETVGVQAGPHGIPVDARLRAGERLWAIGDATGLSMLTHVGKYQGRGRRREHCSASPTRPTTTRCRASSTRPAGGAVGAAESNARHRPVSGLAKTRPTPAPTPGRTAS